MWSANKIALLVAFCIGMVEVASACLGGMQTYNGHCYDLVTEAKSFVEASAHCGEICGGHIAEIDDAAEFNFIPNMAAASDGWKYMRIGARRPVGGAWNDFRLPSNNRAIPFTNWRPSQPLKGCPDCDCANFSKRLHDMWDDNSCAAGMSSICEYP